MCYRHVHTWLPRETHAQTHTHQNCQYGPCLLITFLQRWINLPPCDCSACHQTKLSTGLAMNQGELSAGANSFSLVWPRVPHYDWMTLATPNVKMSYNNPPTPSHALAPVFPRSPQILYFPFSLLKLNKKPSILVHESDANECFTYPNDLAD